MKKDKEWLKAQVKDEECELKSVYDNYVPYEKVLIVDDVNELIDQLDEPEITEEQALNKLAESYPFSADGINTILQAQLAGYSPISTMKFIQSNEPDSKVEYRKGYEQGVLSAIQTANESKLVEIPQFVADYIKKRKKSSYPTLANAFHDSMYDNKISGWLEHYGDSEFITDYVKADKNQELFTLAWNNGYTINPESKMKITIKSYDKIELEIELSESESKKLIDQLKEVPNV